MQGQTALIAATLVLCTTLTHAAATGHPEIIQILVKVGADVNSKSNFVSAADGTVFVSVVLA